MIYGISSNMASSLHTGKCGAINAADTKKMGYYVVKYVYEPFTLHEDKNTDGKVSKEGEIMVRVEYLNMMKAKTNWYWQKNVNKQSVIISTRNIFHSCLDVSVTKYGSDIPSSI